MSGGRIEVLPDAWAAARRAAAHLAEAARQAVADRGRAAVAVSGGRTPWLMFAHLASEQVPWQSTEIHQVDERVAPPGAAERNLTHLLASLPAEARGAVRAMPVDDPDLDRAAERYARSLPGRFDLIHLGLGADGHTASLVPGDPVLDVDDRDVAVTAVYMGRRRMTLTYPALNRARRVLWLVTGDDKAGALRRLRAADGSIPAGRVTASDTMIIADAAAAPARP